MVTVTIIYKTMFASLLGPSLALLMQKTSDVALTDRALFIETGISLFQLPTPHLVLLLTYTSDAALTE